MKATRIRKKINKNMEKPGSAKVDERHEAS